MTDFIEKSKEWVKVVLNSKRDGAFGLSLDGKRRFLELSGFNYIEQINKYGNLSFYYLNPDNNENIEFNEDTIDRNNIYLVQIVEEMGENANAEYASLKIVSLLKGTIYYIDELDGYEYIIQENTIKWKIA
jgi:hypothetical protein